MSAKCFCGNTVAINGSGSIPPPPYGEEGTNNGTEACVLAILSESSEANREGRGGATKRSLHKAFVNKTRTQRSGSRFAKDEQRNGANARRKAGAAK
jgi:hypothetical protein